MDKGWISLHRKITENPYYFAEPFTKMQAWIDMLLIANHKPGFFFKRGIKVEVNRGEIGQDLANLAKRWMWSRGKAERFLNQLENERQIVRQKTNVTTLISIVNYDMYQSDGKANSKPNGKPNGHQTVKQTVKQTDTNNNDNNVNNVNNDNNNVLSVFAELKNSAKQTKEKKSEILDLDSRKEIFKKKLEPFLEKYGRDMLNDFYRYWTESNEGGRKMRFEMEKVFDVSRRLVTWNKNNKTLKNGKSERRRHEPSKNYTGFGKL